MLIAEQFKTHMTFYEHIIYNQNWSENSTQIHSAVVVYITMNQTRERKKRELWKDFSFSFHLLCFSTVYVHRYTMKTAENDSFMLSYWKLYYIPLNPLQYIVFVFCNVLLAFVNRFFFLYLLTTAHLSKIYNYHSSIYYII